MLGQARPGLSPRGGQVDVGVGGVVVVWVVVRQEQADERRDGEFLQGDEKSVGVGLGALRGKVGGQCQYRMRTSAQEIQLPKHIV